MDNPLTPHMTPTLSEYPYFIYPAVMALRKGVDDPAEAERLRRIVAANVGDIPSLRIMLGFDPEEFASFYPDMEAQDLSTTATIDSFLDRFGNSSLPLPQAAAEISERMPEECDEMPDKEAETPTPPLPTEREARILIKNHDYQGALEIIQLLSLNIPEKSVYFADQIRFLKKLIPNEARKNNRKGSLREPGNL